MPTWFALLRRHLEVEGWSVTAVTGGEDAQTALGREEYAVVLTDLVMEPIDGLGVLREASACSRGPESSS
jgi:DNA-binding response OmpR family regulator